MYTLQKRGIRIVGNLLFTAPTAASIFSAYRILPVTELFDHQLSLALCRESSFNNTFRRLSSLSTNVSIFSTRHNELDHILKNHTNYGYEMFSYMLPTFLNNLKLPSGTRRCRPGAPRKGLATFSRWNVAYSMMYFQYTRYMQDLAFHCVVFFFSLFCFFPTHQSFFIIESAAPLWPNIVGAEGFVKLWKQLLSLCPPIPLWIWWEIRLLKK